MMNKLARTEGVLLLRQGDKTMAVHLTEVTVTLEPVIVEHPDVDLGYTTIYGGTALSHYEVEAQGQADRITIWTGPDPFAKPELEHLPKEIQ